MSDSRKTPFVWGTGIALFLFVYLSSPPLLALAFQGGAPPAPVTTIIAAIFYPLKILDDNAPWYSRYLDFLCELVGL
jgi:hypothetical protein